MAEVAGEVKLILSADGTSWSAELDKAQRALNKLKGSTSETSRHARAEMTEARHSIHLVTEEIGVHLPRALQGFVAKLPGVAEVMAHAFSAVAVIGLGMVIVETGKKVYEFIEKQKKASEEAERATKKLMSSREQATLEIEVANAKLDEQIAKLEKKPGDGMKTALAEARLEAFRLGESLEHDVEEAHKLIETSMSAGFLQKTFLAAAGSEGTLDQITKYQEELGKVTETADPKKRTADIQALTVERLKKLDEEIAARKELQALQEKYNKAVIGEGAMPAADVSRLTALQGRFGKAGMEQDQTTVLRGLDTFHHMVRGQELFADATAEQIEKQGHERELQAAKDRADLAKEASEAIKRQTLERVAAMEDELAQAKIGHAMSIEEERAFWQKRYQTGVNLADPINLLIAKRISSLSQEIFKKDQTDAKEWIKMMTDLQSESTRATAQNNPLMPDREEARNASQTEGARMAALHDRPEILRQIADAQNELTASEQVQSNAMEESTARIMHQTAVLRKLRDELSLIEDERIAIRILGPSSYTAQMNPDVLQNQAIQKEAEIQAAQQTLQYQKERDTFGGEMQQMFSEWIKRTTDLRGAVASIFDQSLSTVNSAILKTMTDPYHRGDWKAAGKSIFSGIAGTGLTAAEGALMKAFGLGSHKPTGTAQDPMWIRDAGTAVGKTGSNVFGSILDSSTTAHGGGSAVGSILGAVISAFIPGMASGGTLTTGMPAIVGERGPELFIPSGSGRIIPNDALRGGTSHVWHIDARGSSDPAAVRFAVQRGIMEAAPRIAAGSIAASRDMAARKPLMAR
jgi:hypothetical protein